MGLYAVLALLLLRRAGFSPKDLLLFRWPEETGKNEEA
jgi:hypothetical protein